MRFAGHLRGLLEERWSGRAAPASSSWASAEQLLFGPVCVAIDGWVRASRQLFSAALWIRPEKRSLALQFASQALGASPRFLHSCGPSCSAAILLMLDPQVPRGAPSA